MLEQVRKNKKDSPLRYFKSNYWLYLFLVPGMLFLLIFKYLPMVGLVITFQDYNVVKGILGSPWVGLANFKYLLSSSDFYRIFRNSILLSLYRLLWGFPIPILLAVLMNEMRGQRYKRTMQTILYLPHFISWVVVVGIMYNLLSHSSGIINYVITAFGNEAIPFLTSAKYFRTIVVVSDIWKSAGWGTIVYMAAISGIDPTQYEAAIIDGASRVQRICYITLPAIAGTIIVMLILRLGSILNNGFEQVYLMSNALVSEVSEVFETYTYQVGLREGRFSFASSVGIFQSVVGMLLIYISNRFSKRIGGGGIW